MATVRPPAMRHSSRSKAVTELCFEAQNDDLARIWWWCMTGTGSVFRASPSVCQTRATPTSPPPTRGPRRVSYRTVWCAVGRADTSRCWRRTGWACGFVVAWRRPWRCECDANVTSADPWTPLDVVPYDRVCVVGRADTSGRWRRTSLTCVFVVAWRRLWRCECDTTPRHTFHWVASMRIASTRGVSCGV